VGGYRYGFNGKEKAGEITSDDYDFGARIYDGRVGRWLSLDPLQDKYPCVSAYNFCLNNPIILKDPDGRDIIFFSVDQAFVDRLNNALGLKDKSMQLTIQIHKRDSYSSPYWTLQNMSNYTEQQLKEKGLTDAQAKAYIYLYELNQNKKIKVNLEVTEKPVGTSQNELTTEYDTQEDDFNSNQFYSNRAGKFVKGRGDDFEGFGSLGVMFLHYVSEQVYGQVIGPANYSDNKEVGYYWPNMDLNKYNYSHKYALLEGKKLFGLTWHTAEQDGQAYKIEERIVSMQKKVGNKIVTELQKQKIHIMVADVFENGKYLKSYRVETNLTTGAREYTEFKKEGEISEPKIKPPRNNPEAL
jgi:RHS repeat-associated protein